jgi:ornithine cyclodeaminase/alanine dehydrogenase-like protein (mu-crystallin family)
MSSLVLQGIGVTELGSKKVVYIGTGNIAQRDIAALKANFPDLKAVSYINTGNEPVEFVREATKLQVEVNRTSLDDIAEFDIIICHTNAKAAVLTSDIKKDIKQGAVITTFASEDCSEVASDFFDTSQATVIIDWEQTTREAVELKTAVEQGLADTAALVSMKTLLEKGVSSNDKHYTIYRSHGTPIQNLAALQLLLKNAPSLND